MIELQAQLRQLKCEKEYENKIWEMKRTGYEGRNLRLEDIIAACVSLIPTAVLPAYLARMIEHEAPNALKSTKQLTDSVPVDRSVSDDNTTQALQLGEQRTGYSDLGLTNFGRSEAGHIQSLEPVWDSCQDNALEQTSEDWLTKLLTS